MPQGVLRAERKLSQTLWRRIIAQIEKVTVNYSLVARVISLGFSEKVRLDSLKRLTTQCMGIRKKALTIIDIGSGPGDSVAYILKIFNSPYVVCIDPSPELLRNCLSQLSNFRHVLEPVISIAERLPLRDNAADVASSFYAMRDFYNLAEGVREAVRISRIGLAVGDIFLPKNTLAGHIVRVWVCKIAPLLVELVAPGYSKYYRGICETLDGWLSAEELGKLIEGEGMVRRVTIKKYMLGGLGFVVACK